MSTHFANTAIYSYLANSPLVRQIVFQNNGVLRMTTTKQYDYLNRLTQISSAPSAGGVLPFGYNYSYNQANQRTNDTLADGSYWQYGYDSLGQVTNGCKYFANGTPVAGQQFGYTFDTIGNRTQTQTGGDQTGNNLRVANYSANNLNQITSRDVPPYADIQGASLLTNAVTINGQTAYRNGEYFRAQIPVNNTNSALWTNIIVAGGQSVTGRVFVAQEPETFQYDADGNLTNDGRWAYVWDGENRLVQMTVKTNVGPQYQLTFGYDYQGRRIQKVVATNGVPIYTNNFLYDGWNLVAVLTPGSSLLNAFVWGTDLSGSLQGAGGVGGLLSVASQGTNAFVAFDGNGNVGGLVKTTDGTVAGSYEYGPFGEVIRSTGPMAKANPMHFSSKYQDDESDLIYYGYRYYKPSTGTWPNQDPIGEPGFELVANRPKTEKQILRDERIKALLKLILPTDAGAVERIKNRMVMMDLESSSKPSQYTVNLYCMVQNNSVNLVDSFGLWQWGWPPWGNKKQQCCENNGNPGSELFKTAADNLASTLHDEDLTPNQVKAISSFVRLLILASDQKNACGDVNDVANTCSGFAKNPESSGCALCCSGIYALFPGIGAAGSEPCTQGCVIAFP